MKLTKEECEKASSWLYDEMCDYSVWSEEMVKKFNIINNLIKEHFELIEHAKTLQDEVDRYKHEYYSECDLREKLEEALDKTCEILSYDMQKVDINGDEKLVYENAEKWKEWSLQDD